MEIILNLPIYYFNKNRALSSCNTQSPSHFCECSWL